MNRFVYIVVSLALVLGLLLSACSAPQKPAPAPAPEKPAAVPTPVAPQVTTGQQVLEAAKKEGEVVIWSNVFREKEKFLSVFNGQYPFIKVTVWDASTGSDAVNRLAEEKKAGRVTADIIFSSESDVIPAMTLGLLAEYDWKREGWVNQPSHKFYLNYSANPRTPTYNTDLMSGAEAPKSWDDLKDPKLRGKTAVTSSGAELPLLMAYLWREGDKLNWEKAEKYLTDMVTNTRPRVMSGITRNVGLLAAGDFSLFLGASGDASLFYLMMGAPLAIVPVGQSPGLTRSAALVKDAPHPNAAKIFLDFFTTPEGLLAKTELDFTPVLYPEAAKKDRASQLLKKYGIETVVVPTAVYTAANVDRAVTWWQKLLGVR